MMILHLSCKFFIGIDISDLFQMERTQTFAGKILASQVGFC